MVNGFGAMMSFSQSDIGRARDARDLAVRAVMKLGWFEPSGEVRLAVFRRAGLMIAYHTPFNPLPSRNSDARYATEWEGRRAHLQPYGITVWMKGIGKVFSAGWRDGGDLIVDFYWPGHWEKQIAVALSNPRRNPKTAMQTDAPARTTQRSA